ncbi:MAG: hypothetical protein IIZ12_03930 [Eggerthellaceae bacterium]|nr:hypothetical protein [Eggerthellaceae bacterium]
MASRTRNFKCPNCRESFHIKRYNAHWVRYMPPNFCPMCGERVDDAARKERKQ